MGLWLELTSAALIVKINGHTLMYTRYLEILLQEMDEVRGGGLVSWAK